MSLQERCGECGAYLAQVRTSKGTTTLECHNPRCPTGYGYSAKEITVKESLELQLKEIRGMNRRIHVQNFTRKTQGKNYPIPTGYATAVRRPFRDLLQWMNGVEGFLETLLGELEK